MADSVGSKGNQLCFNDGYVLDANHVFIASQVRDLAHVDASRIAVIIDGHWKFADFDNDALVSVACRHSDGQAVFLGYNGNILIGGNRRPIFEKIPDCDRYGKVLRVRNIGDEFYACGMSGQVYLRGQDSWIHIDDGMLGTTGLEFEDIGGTNSSNIFAVGSFGQVFHFDGSVWQRMEFPSNLPLSGIKCTSDSEVYVCGDSGTFYRGNYDSWEFVGDPEIEHDFWAVETFDGNVYLAYESGIIKFDGNELSEVDIGAGREVDCHRLHANDGVLWSFGVDDLFCFDGSVWNEVICPFNRV